MNNHKLKKSESLPECCQPKRAPENRDGIIWGVIYGIVPHSFCILFVILSVIGATSGTVFLRRFFVIPYLFQILVIVSFLFATLSAAFYLKRNGILSLIGIKRKWKYLTIMYSVTMAVNLMLFYLILPAVGNIRPNKVSSSTNATTINNQQNSPDIQTIEMDQLGGGYQPNTFRVKVGKPVRWLIHSKSQTCAASIYSPKLEITAELNPGDNVIEFTPKETGTFTFSCYMGMYRGTIKVED